MCGAKVDSSSDNRNTFKSSLDFIARTINRRHTDVDPGTGSDEMGAITIDNPQVYVFETGNPPRFSVITRLITSSTQEAEKQQRGEQQRLLLSAW